MGLRSPVQGITEHVAYLPHDLITALAVLTTPIPYVQLPFLHLSEVFDITARLPPSICSSLCYVGTQLQQLKSVYLVRHSAIKRSTVSWVRGLVELASASHQDDATCAITKESNDSGPNMTLVQ